MKKVLLLAATLALCSLPLVQVQADSQDDSEYSQQQWDRHVDEWQERMNTMHRQMQEIDGTTDPEQRQKLLEQHWKLMDEQMLSMRMMGGGMMGSMHGRGHHGRGRHMMDPDERDQYMYDRMDMMHMMMEQMMQHQQMMIRGGMNPR